MMDVYSRDYRRCSKPVTQRDLSDIGDRRPNNVIHNAAKARALFDTLPAIERSVDDQRVAMIKSRPSGTTPWIQ
jgi:hypothetical protein